MSWRRSLLFNAGILLLLLPGFAGQERVYELTIASVQARFADSPYETSDWIVELAQLSTDTNQLEVVLPLWGANALAYPNEIRGMRWSFRGDALGMVFVDKLGGESIAKFDVAAQVIETLVPPEAGFTDMSPPDWSRDSAMLAFSGVDAEGVRQVVLVYLQEDNRLEIVTPGSLPSFSPEGDQLVFLSPDNAIMLWTLADGEGAVFPYVFRDASSMIWSRDGGQLAVTHSGYVTVIDLQLGSSRLMFDAFEYLDISPSAERVQTESAAWSPNNQQVAFVLNVRDNPQIGHVTEVLSLDITSGAVTVHAVRFFPLNAPLPDDARIFTSVTYQSSGAFVPPRDDDSRSDL